MDFRLYFRSRQGEMVHLLKQIATLESPTDDKEAVDACADFVARELRKVGCRVTSHPQKDIGALTVAEFAPGRTKDADDEILVLTHLDTVWPVGQIAKMPFYVQGHRLHGPGVLDMKAGLVMVLAALRALHGLNLKPQKKITVFLNSAEETGNAAVDRAHPQAGRAGPRLSSVSSRRCPGGALKLERKGRLVVRLDVHGRAAHGGTPGEGRQRHRGAGRADRQVQAAADQRDDRQRRPHRRRREGQRRRRERLGDPGHPVLEGLRPRPHPAHPARDDAGPARGPHQGHGRKLDAADGKDQGLGQALRAGPGDRRRNGHRP